METFNDKTVIVTGGSEGVGAAVAKRFAREGANLVIVARTRKNLEKVAEELRPSTRVEMVTMDVTDVDACRNLFKKAEFEFGSVDVLVNNAGYHERGPVESVAADDLGKIIDVNLKAPIVLSRLALPYLRKAKDGAAIINVASLAGRTPVKGAATYSASKFGLRAFTFALGEEIRDSDIKIAAVSPGPIDTGFIMENIDQVADITFSQPMSTAEQVADEVFLLCQNEKRERSMPPISGGLTMVSYLFPWLGRKLLPFLEKKGKKVKREIKIQQSRRKRQASQ